MGSGGDPGEEGGGSPREEGGGSPREWEGDLARTMGATEKEGVVGRVTKDGEVGKGGEGVLVKKAGVIKVELREGVGIKVEIANSVTANLASSKLL